FDLTPLTGRFEEEDFITLYVDQREDQRWYATLESGGIGFRDPESNISDILTVVEGFTDSARADWEACSERIFDIGYNCGTEPARFIQVISTETLRRMANAGATLKITLYPPPDGANIVRHGDVVE